MSEETKNYGLGLIPLPKDKLEAMEKQAFDFYQQRAKRMDTLAALPSKVDLRPQFPPVRNQGSYGTCVAFASAAILDYLDGKNSGRGSNTIIRSPLHLYYPSGKDAGMMITDALDNAFKRGACAELERPYSLSSSSQFTAPVSESQEQSGDFVRGNVGALISIYSSKVSKEQNIAAMKEFLANGTPILFGMTAYESFSRPKSGGIVDPVPGENSSGEHAVVIVGYDDNTGRFIIRNSWGTSYGDNGHCYIKYNDIFYYGYELFVVFKNMYTPYQTGYTALTPFIVASDSSVLAIGDILYNRYRFVKFTATRTGTHTFTLNTSSVTLYVKDSSYVNPLASPVNNKVSLTLSAGTTIIIGLKALSNETGVTLSVTYGGTTPTPPSPPSLTIGSITETSVKLSFNASNATLFYVYQDNIFLASVAGSSGSYTVTGLSQGNTYSFHVIALNPSGAAKSITVTATTKTTTGSSFDNPLIVPLSGTISAQCPPKKVKVYFKWTAPKTGSFTFETKSNLDLKGELYNQSKLLIKEDDDSGDNSNPKIVYNVTVGQVYYFVIFGYSDNTSGSFDVAIKDASLPQDPFPVLSNITVGTSGLFTFKEGETVYFKYTHARDREEMWFETICDAGIDIVASLHDHTGTQLATGDDEAGNRQPRIKYTLSRNDIVYFKVYGYRSSDRADFKVKVT